jgi:GNAT superfamily N-acetyltransferase
MLDSETSPSSVPDNGAIARADSQSTEPASPRSPTWRWVPIRSLGPRHRPKIGAHLLSLDVADRYLRFGYAASDEQIANYVAQIDFERDEVFGICNRRLDLVAVAHLAHLLDSEPPASEFGVSVLARARGRGLGHRLFDHATLHARNRGVRRLLIHALSENNAMLKIARDFGATIERFGAESQAWLQLPPDTIASRVGEIVEQRAAEIDYRIKQRALLDETAGLPVQLLDSDFGTD